MQEVSIEYNRNRAALVQLLESIDRPGDYCTHGRLFVPMPRIEVDQVGTIAFPVLEMQTQALIRAAERAPYGRGPETLIDDTVRAGWQLDAKKVHLGGDGWKNTFTQILGEVSTGLGYPVEQVCAEFYKLLIYGPGGFFSAHRDTEKKDGMVATLVIALPTAGAGGELVIDHKGRKTVVDMGPRDPSELAFAAFFADCVHEVRAVTEGYRITLTYNLILQNGATGAAPGNAPYYGDQVETIATLLSEWGRDDEAEDKIVWLLEHDYSEAGLSFATLKNVDAALGRVLTQAARRADCALYAAILHIEEYGNAEYVDIDYFERGHGRGYYGGPDELDYEMGELVEAWHWLEGWTAPDGIKPEYEKIPLLPEELLPPDALDDAEPDEQRVNEASGNEGVSVERAYRRAALVLWPNAKTLANLVQGGITGAINHVEAELERSAGQAEAEGRIRKLFAQLIDLWPPLSPYLESRNGEDRSRMLRLLHTLTDKAMTRRFLHQVMIPHYRSSDNEDLVIAAAKIGPEGMRDFLSDFVAMNLPKQTAAVIELVWRLCKQLDGQEGDAWRAILRDAARAVYRGLPLVVEPPKDDESPWRRRRIEPFAVQTIRDLFLPACRLDLENKANDAAMLLTGYPQIVIPERALPQALAELQTLAEPLLKTTTFTTLWCHAARHLLARSATPPKEPQDWVLTVKIGCDCWHCRTLQVFCNDPMATTTRFAVRQELRSHLRHTIKYHQLDIHYETERRGRPYTLICTKTRDSYKRRLAQYTKDIEHMQMLIASAPPDRAPAWSGADDLERLRTAVAP